MVKLQVETKVKADCKDQMVFSIIFLLLSIKKKIILMVRAMFLELLFCT